jgi:hypothetical protein
MLSVLSVTIGSRRKARARSGVMAVQRKPDVWWRKNTTSSGRDLLRSHNQITLVLSVLVIDDNYDFAPADCLNSVADLGEASVLVPAIHLECRIAPTV